MKKKRRTIKMEEAKKELKAEGIEEIEKETVEGKYEELKVRDYTDIVRELKGVVRENYLMSFQLFTSLWEGNLKIISNQIEQRVAVQQEYITLNSELSGKLPTEAINFWNSNSKSLNKQFEKMFDLQKDYAGAVMDTSERFMKEASSLMKKSLERIFSSLEDYMNLIED